MHRALTSFTKISEFLMTAIVFCTSSAHNIAIIHLTLLASTSCCITLINSKHATVHKSNADSSIQVSNRKIQKGIHIPKYRQVKKGTEEEGR